MMFHYWDYLHSFHSIWANHFLYSQCLSFQWKTPFSIRIEYHSSCFDWIHNIIVIICLCSDIVQSRICHVSSIHLGHERYAEYSTWLKIKQSKYSIQLRMLLSTMKCTGLFGSSIVWSITVSSDVFLMQLNNYDRIGLHVSRIIFIDDVSVNEKYVSILKKVHCNIYHEVTWSYRFNSTIIWKFD
jgi:hypothetical protein